MKKTLGIVLGGLMVLALSTSFAAAASTDSTEAPAKNPAPYCRGYNADNANGRGAYCRGNSADGTKGGQAYCNGQGRHQGRGHGRFRNADGTCSNPNCPNYKAESSASK